MLRDFHYNGLFGLASCSHQSVPWLKRPEDLMTEGQVLRSPRVRDANCTNQTDFYKFSAHCRIHYESILINDNLPYGDPNTSTAYCLSRSHKSVNERREAKDKNRERYKHITYMNNKEVHI